MLKGLKRKIVVSNDSRAHRARRVVFLFLPHLSGRSLCQIDDFIFWWYIQRLALEILEKKVHSGESVEVVLEKGKIAFKKKKHGRK